MAASTSPPRFEQRKRVIQPLVRLARLVPTPAFAPTVTGDGDIVIEVGGTRMTVGRGADLTTVVTVLAMLGGRS